MFCGCSTDLADARPNSLTCPVCLGLPGALPVINREAVRHVLATGLAIGATIPDQHALGPQELLLSGPAEGLPDQPVRPAARLGRDASAWTPRRARSEVGITRAHLEEDTARLIHRIEPGGRAVSLVDFDRSGTPLMEIVTDPVIRVGRGRAPLRRGAAPAPRDDRRLGRRDGERPDARRGERLAASRRERHASGRASRSRT